MVLQRWQTVLLLVAVVVMTWFNFVSVGTVNTQDFTYSFYSAGFEYYGDYENPEYTGWMMHTWSFLIMSVMSALLPLITIFCYRNLKLQKRLCMIECLFLCVTVAIGAWYGYNGIADSSISWNQMSCAPLLSFCAVIFAWGLINSDKKRIESVDRLR